MRHDDSRPLIGAANRAALAHRRAKPVDRRCPRLPTGALPRNQLAYSAAGSASLISSKAARSSRRRRRVAAFPKNPVLGLASLGGSAGAALLGSRCSVLAWRIDALRLSASYYGGLQAWVVGAPDLDWRFVVRCGIGRVLGWQPLLLAGIGGACAVAGLRTGGALQGTRVRWESAAGSPSTQKAPPTRQTNKAPSTHRASAIWLGFC